MAMDFLRGLFGSSARNVKAAPQAFQAYADPKLDDPISRTLGNDTMTRAPVLTPDPVADRADSARKWEIIGATLQDVGGGLNGRGGGSLERVQAGYRQRAAKEQGDADMARLRQMAAELYPDDEQAQFLFSLAPDEFAKQQLDARKPEKPVLVNTRLGPRLYTPSTGDYKTLEDIPERLPPGYMYDEQGRTVIDPEYVAGQGALAEARAGAAAKYRAPPRARAGGGGARPAAAPAIPPWKRTW